MNAANLDYLREKYCTGLEANHAKIRGCFDSPPHSPPVTQRFCHYRQISQAVMDLLLVFLIRDHPRLSAVMVRIPQIEWSARLVFLCVPSCPLWLKLLTFRSRRCPAVTAISRSLCRWSHPDHPDDRKATARTLQRGRRSEGSCACFLHHPIVQIFNVSPGKYPRPIILPVPSIATLPRPLFRSRRSSALISVKVFRPRAMSRDQPAPRFLNFNFSVLPSPPSQDLKHLAPLIPRDAQVAQPGVPRTRRVCVCWGGGAPGCGLPLPLLSVDC